MQVGRKIYYESPTGIIIWDKGEMSGDIRETTLADDKTVFPELAILDAAGSLGVLQLNYGARSDEFANLGTYNVDITQTPPALIIYPHFTMSASKTTITPDGVDTVTITIIVPGTAAAHPIVFTSSTGVTQTIDTVSGVATLTVTSISTERVTITATSDLYGSGSIVITPTTDVEKSILDIQNAMAFSTAIAEKKEESI
jgi:hypothetical protein